jgi:glycosyltransferase involved in cell wall biosynthesis
MKIPNSRHDPLSEIPWVSIVVSAYNGDAHLLPRAIKSLAAQELPKEQMQVVIAYDGTPDEEACTHLQELEKIDLSTELYGTKEATGYYAAPRNRVMPILRGHYVSFLDADNEYAPTHLSGLLHAIRVPHPRDGWPHFVYSRREYIRDTECPEDKCPVQGPSKLVPWTKEVAARLQNGPKANFIDTGDLLIGRATLYELAEKTGMVWNTSYRRFGDWELINRLAGCGFRGLAVDQTTNRYFWTGNNLQTNRAVSDITAIPESIYNKLVAQGLIKT